MAMMPLAEKPIAVVRRLVILRNDGEMMLAKTISSSKMIVTENSLTDLTRFHTESLGFNSTGFLSIFMLLFTDVTKA